MKNSFLSLLCSCCFFNVFAQTPITNPDLIISCPYDIIFVLDESGSIVGQGTGATNINTQVRSGALGLINALNGSGSRVTVVEFNSNARRATIGGSTAYQEVTNTYVNSFTTYITTDNNTTPQADRYDPEDYSCTGGTPQCFTNWEAAFLLVQTINNTDGLAQLIIFFTDGQPTAYINQQGTVTQGTDNTTQTQALNEAIVAANGVKTQGSHIFVVAIPNPTLPEANIIAISDPDRYPDIEPDFVKADYSVSTTVTLQQDLANIANNVCKIDLRLEKTATQSTACIGDTIVFTLTLYNEGLDNGSGIEVTDVIPNGYTYLNDNGGAATSETNGVVVWDVNTLNVSDSAVLQITVMVNASGDYKNTAQVTAANQEDPDSTPNNDDGDQSEDDEAAFTVTVITDLFCDDGEPCTIDYCEAGECINENTCCLSNLDCDDGDACTTDECDGGFCVNTPVEPDVTFDFASTCNPDEVGEVSDTILNQFGCDSIIISITTLTPSNDTLIELTTCIPDEAGETVDSLLNQFGCDSIVTTITTLLPSYDTLIETTTCIPQLAGEFVDSLFTRFGCDSVVTTIITLLPSNDTLIESTTCNSQLAGEFVDSLLNQFGCDSVVTTFITLLPSNDTLFESTTCNPQLARDFVDSLLNEFGCDSIITTIVTLLPSNDTLIELTTCIPDEAGETVDSLLNQFGCDSIVTTITTLLPSNDILIETTTCNPQLAGEFVDSLFNRFGCDSVVTTIITLLPSNNTLIESTTCNPQLAGEFVDSLLNQFGCDSVVTTNITLLPSNDTLFESTTCNPQLAGEFVDSLLNQFGCDSVVTTIITLLPSNDTLIESTTCNPQLTGEFVDSLLNQFGCDSVVTTNITLLPSNDTLIQLITCNPAEEGTVVDSLLNQFGCDSVVTNISTLLICDDGDPCTLNFCDPQTGCSYEDKNCDDNNLCTTDFCVNGICIHQNITCDDGDPCTVGKCEPDGNCVYVPITCDDGEICTDDSCIDGDCIFTPIACDDGDPCTFGICDPVDGCIYLPVECDDNDPCTIDFCNNGVCEHEPDPACCVCDDGDPCTVDACINNVCVFTPTVIQTNIQKSDISCACQQPQQICILNFEGLPHGTILGSQYAAYGIHISATANAPGKNAAIVFDTYQTGTPDPDLEVGIGNIAVIAQDLIDVNPADGLVDKPNDNMSGGKMTFHFDTERTIVSFVYVDKEKDTTYAVAFDAFNNPIDSGMILPLGDMSVQTVVMNTPGVRRLEYKYRDSGGITDIIFGDCDSTCCDGTAFIVPNGDTPPYSYAWSTGDTTAFIDSLCDGLYFVTITDGNGCVQIDSVTIGNADNCAPCSSSADCDDGNPCTSDLCILGACSNTLIPGCVLTSCSTDLDCDDGNLCTTDICVQNICQHDEALQVVIETVELPEFCQGEKIQAVTESEVSYLWSNGDTTASIIVLPGVNYRLTVTDVNGCRERANYTANIIASQNMLSSYVMVAQKDISLWNNTVVSGGVGITDAYGKMKLNQATDITSAGTFAISKSIQLTGNSNATSQFLTPAPVTFPAFEFNPNNANNNLNIPNNTTVTLTGDNYGGIVIGTNSTVIFTETDLYVKNITAKSNATIKFADCTRLKIKSKLLLGVGNSFNPDTSDVLVFVEDGVDVERGSTVIADIYVLKGRLNVKTGNANEPITMIGLFFANNIHAKDFTSWHQNPRCPSCGIEEPPAPEFCLGNDREVYAFTLVNAASNLDIGPLLDGDTIDLAVTGPISVRADVCDETIIGSVRFILNGVSYRIENIFFYTIAGDNNGNYTAWNVQPGVYTITAVPHASAGGYGATGISLTVTITIINSIAPKLSQPDLKENLEIEDEVLIKAYPNPFKNTLIIEFSLSKAERVRIDLLSMEGRLVATLFEGNTESHQMQRIEFNSGNLAEGLYSYRFVSESGKVLNRKIMLMR